MAAGVQRRSPPRGGTPQTGRDRRAGSRGALDATQLGRQMGEPRALTDAQRTRLFGPRASPSALGGLRSGWAFLSNYSAPGASGVKCVCQHWATLRLAHELSTAPNPEAHHPSPTRHLEACHPGCTYGTVLCLLHLDPQDSLCKQLQRWPSALPGRGEHVITFGWGLGRGVAEDPGGTVQSWPRALGASASGTHTTCLPPRSWGCDQRRVDSLPSAAQTLGWPSLFSLRLLFLFKCLILLVTLVYFFTVYFLAEPCSMQDLSFLTTD